jgi:hypothetical protein
VEIPQALAQHVIEFALPLPRQERNNLAAPGDVQVAVAPLRISRVRLHPLWIAAGPRILGGLHFLDRRFASERRHRWTTRTHSILLLLSSDREIGGELANATGDINARRQIPHSPAFWSCQAGGTLGLAGRCPDAGPARVTV